MPAFPHTLIGLGPFADLGCKIVFTKTSVTVYHPDGHPILSGWRDETGPHLGHFPLTTEAAQVTLENASPQPPIPLTAEAAHVAVDEASHPLQSFHHLHALHQQMCSVPRGNKNGGGGNEHGHGMPLSSRADIHAPADASPLACHPLTSTRIAWSGGVDAHPTSAHHIASTHYWPTRLLQQSLHHRVIRIPAMES